MLVLIEFMAAVLFVFFVVVVFFICNRWLKKKSLSRDDDLYNLKDAKNEVNIFGVETDPIAEKILINPRCMRRRVTVVVLCVCPSVCLSVCLPVCLSVCLSACLSVINLAATYLIYTCIIRLSMLISTYALCGFR